MDLLPALALVVLFVLIGGVFAAAEISLVSLRDSQVTRMERESARGARVAAIARDPNRFLAAVQIGVTVAGFFSAAYGGSTLAPDVAPYLVDLGLPSGAADTAALASMTPGRSLPANTSGFSIAPWASTTCLARTFHSRSRGAPSGTTARWSVRRWQSPTTFWW